jgi:predicted PurR-regulated permease PerM
MATRPWSSLLEAPTPLLYVATIALLVTLLSCGQAVLVPLALAVMLTFILTPVVTALERRSLPRIAAVAVVIVLTLGVVGGLGYVFSRQFGSATQVMPCPKRLAQTSGVFNMLRNSACLPALPESHYQNGGALLLAEDRRLRDFL